MKQSEKALVAACGGYCLGCHGSIHKPWCPSCSIQQYTGKREILTCAFCDEFPCENLEKYYEKDRCGDVGDEFRAHIFRQKEIGVETAEEAEIKFMGM